MAHVVAGGNGRNARVPRNRAFRRGLARGARPANGGLSRAETLERSDRGLPRYVERELRGYLRCGLLKYGLHLVCQSCGHSELVALSCKKRGFCPSCIGRRMADTSVHLEQHVLPAVPIRHWICSLPWGLRSLLGYDKRLCAEVVGAFVGELSRSLERRAKQALGLSSMSQALTGAVVSVSRTDSALRLNVHLHVLALDGVYVREDEGGPLLFHGLPTPTRSQVAEVARRTAARIEKLLTKAGRSLDPQMGDDTPPELVLDEPGLAACYAAAAQGLSITGDRAGQPPLRLIASRQAEPRGFCRRRACRRGPRRECLRQAVRRRTRPQTARAALQIHHPAARRPGTPRATTRRKARALLQEYLEGWQPRRRARAA